MFKTVWLKVAAECLSSHLPAVRLQLSKPAGPAPWLSACVFSSLSVCLPFCHPPLSALGPPSPVLPDSLPS